ncbi:DUF4132 domain-containing protein [Runella limosa]|uniref:DUF4132 domain-containing protein n=1 Tax=Runella limosa TaxID=370978 RepID=UPI0004167F09|nr:DUF4132 domain-containing protein [Runella limosa]
MNQDIQLENYINTVKKGYCYIYYHTTFDQIFSYLGGETEQCPRMNNLSSWLLHELFDLLPPKLNEWGEFHERVMNIATQPNVWEAPKHLRDSSHGCYSYFFRWMIRQLEENSSLSLYLVKQLESHAQKYKITLPFFVNGLVFGGANLLETSAKPTGLGLFILERLEENKTIYFQAFQPNYLPYLTLLLATKPDFVHQHVTTFLQFENQIQVVDKLLNFDAPLYEPYIEKRLEKVKNSENLIAISQLLLDNFPDKYQSRTTELMLKIISKEHHIMKSARIHYRPNSTYVQHLGRHVTFLETSIDYLLKNKIEGAEEIILSTLKDCYQIPIEVIKGIALHLGQNGIDLIMEGLRMNLQNLNWENNSFFKEYFKLLGTLDFRKYEEEVWALSAHKTKKIRELAAVTLSKLGNHSTPKAAALLQHKKAEVRQLGALILSLIKTDESLAILTNALESEKNDDARDLMLQGLSGLMSASATKEQLQDKIAKAQERGKLDNSIESWLQEAQLPSLTYLDGDKLTPNAIRFLFYRMSRAKDIRIDLEAKILLELIDKSQAQPFAEAVLKNYFSMGGADAKQKFCLTLGSILGGDAEIDLLKRKVNEWVDAGRGKMAEYAVKAIALNGSTKALRVVEFFSRKYKNKNKNIGAAANESFGLVAEELGISPYDLADSIIPDFGFEGLFKPFEVNEDAYRAFIDNNFKLAFLNEDNKVVKSLPKGTAKELQEEFKEIGKEIRDIVKSQSGRLEQYLVIQRKWSSEKWQAFFMTNPIMFVYAIRLIWGAFDQNQQLHFTFKVQEDQTLIDENGDEIELEEDLFIGMVHPLQLNQAQKEYWIETLSDADLSPIFPQLNRNVIEFDEKETGKTISKKFQGIEMSGYAFVARLEKTGWFRGSVVDGGGISSYYKDFSELNITTILLQQGNIGVGYLDENAILGELMFVSNKSVHFGSYVYDEPSKIDDPRLIPFEQVPAIVYSEIMADMQFFKENDARKQNDTQNGTH